MDNIISVTCLPSKQYFRLRKIGKSGERQQMMSAAVKSDYADRKTDKSNIESIEYL